MTPHLTRTLLCGSILAVSAHAQFQLAVPTASKDFSSGLNYAGQLIDGVLTRGTQAPSGSKDSTPTASRDGFQIVIVPDAGLAGNTAALPAFNRAAQSWATRIKDPITVTINASLAPLGTGIIGSANSVSFSDDFATVRNLLISDAARESDDGIVAHLPTVDQFSAYVPNGAGLAPVILFTKANAKAMGYTGLDEALGASDATITFSSAFSFDYDRSDGISAGTMDFETVAAHEIGHALGFSSYVDSVNAGALTLAPTTLDLFRFVDLPGYAPENAADFSVVPRNLIPGIPAITSQIDGPSWGMSTGTTNAAFPGTDGRQASHWLADELTNDFIGMMDPTLNFGVSYDPTAADFRAFDLIGFDVEPVPEPSTALAGAAVALAAFGTRRRSARSRA